MPGKGPAWKEASIHGSSVQGSHGVWLAGSVIEDAAALGSSSHSLAAERSARLRTLPADASPCLSLPPELVVPHH